MTMFEWQEIFDGQQFNDNRLGNTKIADQFRALVGDLMLNHIEHLRPGTGMAGVLLSTGADELTCARFMYVFGDAKPEPDNPQLVLLEWTPPQNAVAFQYSINEGLVCRTDMTLENWPVARRSEDHRENIALEASMGLNGQPITTEELEHLTIFSDSGRPIQVISDE